jgi:hypothetical protein
VRREVLLAVPAVVALSTVVGGVAVAGTDPALRADDPTSVTGTDGTAVFDIGVHHVRHVRYQDQGTLRYTFRLHNEGALPVTLNGLAEEQPRSRLLGAQQLTGAEGEESPRIPAGGSALVTLSLLMSGCETLSARAGSILTDVVVRTDRGGVFADDVTVRLPEELRTGSPREARCPNATATSRPRG